MKKIPILSVVLLLAACQQPPPQPPAPVPPPPMPAPQPPAKPKPVLPPAQTTAGSLTNANVEAYMDKLERSLRGLMRGTSVRIMRRGDTITVDIPNGIIFSGEAIGPQGRTLIVNLARAFRYYDHTVGQVNGYTDTHGDFAANVELSRARATRVRDALAAYKLEGRFTAHGFGPAKLRIHTADQVKEPRNRRIEIVILPKPE